MQNQYLNIYNETTELISSRSATIFNKNRTSSATRFAQYGLPTQKSEDYLYCPLFDSLSVDWGMNFNRLLFGLKQEDMFRCSVPGIHATTAYVINDVWVGDEEKIDLGSGAFVSSMSYASQHHMDLLERYYNKIYADSKDGFILLNEMFAQEGVFVYVPKNVQVELPLQVVNMMRAGMDVMVNSRNLIVVEESAELYCIECDHAFDSNRYFASRVTEVFVAANAKLHFCAMESSSPLMNNLRKYAVSMQRDSRLNMSFYGLTNGNTRNDVEVDMHGEGAEVWLGGMLLGDKEQRCENFTTIRHKVSNCRSEELYKYIVDDKAVAGFSGRILVEKGAQKTESHQTNRNISLSKDARILGRPQLEIYADDVKCGHGATTGMLDQSALFYMQQRGIALKEARLLLLQAFSADVVDKIHIDALR
ncbi:MAG: Fe-S cluster assembly protein SufD, partial [bacterium]